MVKKLFKHEFKAWLRVMAIVWAVMLAFAGVYRLFLCFESDSIAYTIISVLALCVYIIGLSVCLVFCEIFGVVRFYKNLFSGEGYLSFTLPVTAGEHIWVKALTHGAMMLITMLVVCISLLILSAGEVFAEISRAATSFWGNLPEEALGHIIGYGAELLILMLVSFVFSPMLYYACICIGQLFRKHRVLGAIGIYFGYYYICQIIASIFTGLMAAFGENAMDQMFEQAVTFPYGQIHSLFCYGILGTALIGMVYFVICHRIMTRKLNLE